MSEFLLLAHRPTASAELSPTSAARALYALSRWHGSLSRWGLRREAGVADGLWQRPAAALMVNVSGQDAAIQLARGWAHLGDCEVAVIRMFGRVESAGGWSA